MSESHRPVVKNGRIYWLVDGMLLAGVGGAAGEPTPAPAPAPAPTDSPKHVTLDDVNAAITGRLKRELEGAMKPILEQLAKIQGAPPSPTPAPSDEGKKGGDSDEVKSLRARVEAAERASKAAADERENEKKERLRAEEREALAGGLDAVGVKDARLKRAAASLLYNDEKRLKRGVDGKILFVIPKAGYAEEVSLEEGLKEWAKGEDAKAFLPATGAAGSGGSGGKNPGKLTGDPVKDKAIRLQNAQNVLMSAVKGIR